MPTLCRRVAWLKETGYFLTVFIAYKRWWKNQNKKVQLKKRTFDRIDLPLAENSMAADMEYCIFHVPFYHQPWKIAPLRIFSCLSMKKRYRKFSRILKTTTYLTL